MRIHHIGYLVRNIEKAKKSFSKLGYAAETEIVYDEHRKANICFLVKDGYRVELVSPTGRDSVVWGVLRRCGNAPYHICYESDSFESDVAALEAEHCTRIDEPCAAPALGGRRVVFLMSAAFGMFEVAEA